jgi:hypothetical protein
MKFATWLMPPASDGPTTYQALVLRIENLWNELEQMSFWPFGRAAYLAGLQKRQRAAKEIARTFFADPARADLFNTGKLSISTGAAPYDYQFLYSYILTHKPKKILELGSGVSSIFIAHALRAAATAEYRGHLHTMEDQPSYYENAVAICPDELKPWVSHHLSAQQLSKWRGTWINHYRQLPEGPFDFIFSDGPDDPGMKVKSGMKREGQPLGVINGDALRVLETYPDHVADLLIDGRRHTLQTIARFMPPGKVQRDAALNLGFVRQATAGDLTAEPAALRRIPNRDIFAGFGLPGARAAV